MTAVFSRLQTDGSEVAISINNLYAGPQPSACWLIGGGPSLSMLPIAEIAASPLPKMTINLAGTRLIRPTFWTSYDPTARFHRSVYLDPSITKFVHRRRAMEIVPDSTFKVCECPNVIAFDRQKRGYREFVSPSATGILDWSDSFVQAIDLLYQLGFRIIYLAGCEMRVRLSTQQKKLATTKGVSYDARQSLRTFLRDCKRSGISAAEFDNLPNLQQYHFDDHKPFAAAVQTDWHYFRITQMLRLSRTAMATAGLQLVSVTPHSRLNDFFPYVPARKVARFVETFIGSPNHEPVRGLLSRQEPRLPNLRTSLQDIPSPTNHRDDSDFVIESEGPIRCH
ncbi:hypothetical protein [Thalassoroseus pseudoceratinae]|uniref:hypothetical protein n=1 Tax=Thalassoroseus pseudoceratinae TaxID=2713176 RepID=UPI001420FB60|nr:hypothetical protein [Thalassoroseus pseudoceratinae]